MLNITEKISVTIDQANIILSRTEFNDSKCSTVEPIKGNGINNAVFRIFLTNLQQQSPKSLILLISPEHEGLRIKNTVNVIQYVTTHSNIPVPRLYHFETNAQLSIFGFPYVLMEDLKGKLLSCCLNDLSIEKKKILSTQLADILVMLQNLKF